MAMAPRGFLSAFGPAPRKSDLPQVALWSSIFKNDHWLKEAMEVHNIGLVLIGPELSQVQPGNEQGEIGYSITI
jgi:hypothetical protein